MIIDPFVQAILFPLQSPAGREYRFQGACAEQDHCRFRAILKKSPYD